MPEPEPPFQTSIIPSSSTIILGLSGGPDSMYLLHKLHAVQAQLNINIIAAHLDHEWQESSKVAAQICQNACDNLKVPLVTQKMSELTYSAQWNGSQEEFGRNMRRHFFATLAQKYQAAGIALAHHQQDQQETFFIRLLRGSSLTGLTGMKEKDGLYIRPILGCTKTEIIDYLEQHAIAYYTDPTNGSDHYLRNRIRHHVVPALQNTDHRFEQNLRATMDQLKHVEDFLTHHTAETLVTISSEQGIDLQKFLNLHIVMQQRLVLQLMIAAQVTFTPSQKLFKEIMRFLEKSPATQHTIHISWMVQKSRSHFVIKKIKKSDKTL